MSLARGALEQCSPILDICAEETTDVKQLVRAEVDKGVFLELMSRSNRIQLVDTAIIVPGMHKVEVRTILCPISSDKGPVFAKCRLPSQYPE